MRMPHRLEPTPLESEVGRVRKCFVVPRLLMQAMPASRVANAALSHESYTKASHLVRNKDYGVHLDTTTDFRRGARAHPNDCCGAPHPMHSDCESRLVSTTGPAA